MKNAVTSKRFSVIAVLVFFISGFSVTRTLAQGTSKAQPETPKTAVQQFKNIQVLKDIPGEQLIPTMQFISASLGADCEF
jgi:hypothetical protein